MGDENEKKELTPQEQIAKALEDLNAAGQTYKKAVEDSGQTYSSDLETIGTNLKTSIDESGNDMTKAGQTYLDIANTWIQAANTRADTQRKINEEMEQQNKRVRTIGGLAEAASALVNVLGTVHGASNQQWQSPQPQWAERADKYRLERDRKLENYREMKQTLERQRAQIQYGIGTDAAKRKAETAKTLADLGAKRAAVKYNSAIDAAKAGVEAATTSANTAIRGIDVLLGNDARQRSINNDSRRIANETRRIANETRRIEAYERNQGMDPRTGKFYNPATGKYDLDAPHISMVQDNPGNTGGGDPDTVMRTAFAADTSVLDELVHAFGEREVEAMAVSQTSPTASQTNANSGQTQSNGEGQTDGEGTSETQTQPTTTEQPKSYIYNTYADYAGAGKDRKSARAKRQLEEEHREVVNLIRKFNDSTGTLKFTVADLNLLEKYAPEYYEKYKAGMGVIAADIYPDTSSPFILR